MKHLKRLGVAGALVMTALGIAGSAQATQLTPLGTHVTFHSTNALLTLHTGGTVRCSSTITGRIPSTAGATTQTFGINLAYTGCNTNGSLATTVDVGAACNSTSTPTLSAMGIGSNQAVWQVTIPTGCNIAVTIPSLSCTLTINGHQTVGNGTTGIGGGTLTGGSDPVLHLNSTFLQDVVIDGPTVTACSHSPIMTASGTLTGTYTSSSTIDIDGS